MQISDKMKTLIRIGRRLAKNSEFMYKTAHRRPPTHPSQAIAEHYARTHRLKWPTW